MTPNTGSKWDLDVTVECDTYISTISAPEQPVSMEILQKLLHRAIFLAGIHVSHPAGPC